MSKRVKDASEETKFELNVGSGTGFASFFIAPFALRPLVARPSLLDNLAPVVSGVLLGNRM